MELIPDKEIKYSKKGKWFDDLTSNVTLRDTAIDPDSGFHAPANIPSPAPVVACQTHVRGKLPNHKNNVYIDWGKNYCFLKNLKPIVTVWLNYICIYVYMCICVGICMIYSNTCV